MNEGRTIEVNESSQNRSDMAVLTAAFIPSATAEIYPANDPAKIIENAVSRAWKAMETINSHLNSIEIFGPVQMSGSIRTFEQDDDFDGDHANEELKASSLLTVSEAAHLLKIKSSTLNGWRHEGRGPRYVKLDGAVRYRQADLDAYIESNLRTSTSELPETTLNVKG